VDPVDGTREFIKRNGEFAVMIGLAVAGSARLGVVFRPVTAELFAGVVEQEAWLEQAGATVPLRVSGETRPSRLRLTTSRSHRHRLVDDVRRRLGISEQCRIGSVGIKVGLLVTGRADVYLEPSALTKAWDSCAPEAILRAAGGRMTALDGTPLRYTPRDVRNRQGLVGTNGACHDTVMAAIASILPTPDGRSAGPTGEG
jgi:3'(2'), 5'-bisphosphate nucleotidase